MKIDTKKLYIVNGSLGILMVVIASMVIAQSYGTLSKYVNVTQTILMPSALGLLWILLLSILSFMQKAITYLLGLALIIFGCKDVIMTLNNIPGWPLWSLSYWTHLATAGIIFVPTVYAFISLIVSVAFLFTNLAGASKWFLRYRTGSNDGNPPGK